MKYYDRNQTSQDIIKDICFDGIKILDCGSRDGDLLKYTSKLCKTGKLVAIDWHSHVNGDIEFINYNLEEKLNFEDSSFDLVICNNVLEHIENKKQLYSELTRVSSKYVLLSLPNIQFYKYILGLYKGNMGKQYIFDVDDGSDRHRWVTFYNENIKFMKSAENFECIKYYDVIPKTGARSLILKLILRLLNKKYRVNNQVMLLKRKEADNG